MNFEILIIDPRGYFATEQRFPDIKIINKHGYTPYDAFFSEINNKIPVLDVTSYLKSTDVESLYTEDLYGGHFSELGNKLVADKVYDYLHKSAFL